MVRRSHHTWNVRAVPTVCTRKVGAPGTQGIPEHTFLFWRPEIQLLQLFYIYFGVDAAGAGCAATKLLLDISMEAQCQPLSDYKPAGEILSEFLLNFYIGCAAEIMGLHICQTD